jgi:hypothetical protein
MKDDNQKGTLINDQRAYNIYHFLTGTGSIAESVASCYKRGKVDFRELAIRAVLYNRQRERTFSEHSYF